MPHTFRPELQGLRAIAVGLVVAYHLHPGALPGGFVGVDVFFVISGFLITGQLVAMAERPDGISLTRFWAGRIRRLLPAASVVLAACLVAMLLLVPPAQWQRTVIEIGASALYVQNWTLAANAVDYLGGDDAPTLVQHFWSLSVEEQFYLVWPLLLLAAVAMRRRGAKAVALSVVLVASLTYSVLLWGDPTSYFNTGTRAWEFAAGGLLALAPALGMPRRLAAAASWTGVALIAVSALALSGATPFPGIAALLPVAGAALVIAAGHGPPWSAGGLMALPPMRFVGDISYSLYLWHWPVIVLAGWIVGDEFGVLPTVAIVLISIGLAALTKRFVEDPPRRARGLTANAKWTYAGAALVVVALVAGSGATWGAVETRTAASEQTALERFEHDPCFGAGAMREGAVCADPFSPEGVDTAFAAQDRGVLAQRCNSYGTEPVECVFGETDDPALTVAIVGNSHAAVLVPALEAYGAAHDWRIILMRKTDCLGVSTLPYPQPAGTDCTDWTAAVQSRLAEPDIDVVVFGTHRNALYYLADAKQPDFDVSALQPHIASTFAGLTDLGKAVVVVGDTPGTRPDPAPECVYLHRDQDDPCAVAAPTDGLDDGNVESLAAQQTPNVRYVSLLPSVCDPVTCHVVVGGTVVYFDDHHLSASFARSLAPELGRAVDDALDLAHPPIE
jgi:peptidoglycan/LPS O-acetylase OafA/YrhL